MPLAQLAGADPVSFHNRRYPIFFVRRDGLLARRCTPALKDRVMRGPVSLQPENPTRISLSIWAAICSSTIASLGRDQRSGPTLWRYLFPPVLQNCYERIAQSPRASPDRDAKNNHR
jgi:hypothetical protein